MRGSKVVTFYSNTLYIRQFDDIAENIRKTDQFVVIDNVQQQDTVVSIKDKWFPVSNTDCNCLEIQTGYLG